MAEGTPSPYPSERHRSDDSPRGERSTGAREGGFRIRLSDNEMRSARALQEAFGLRSTVAVLGFALRTLGQQLEDGQLAQLVEQHRSQASSRAGSGEGGGRGEGRRERSEGRGGGGGGRWQEGRGTAGRSARVDPFARPPRPETVAEAVEADAEPPTDQGAVAEAVLEASAEPVADAGGAEQPEATSGADETAVAPETTEPSAPSADIAPA
jgi:hypothetical protein